jgi:hypothetical protein
MAKNHLQVTGVDGMEVLTHSGNSIDECKQTVAIILMWFLLMGPEQFGEKIVGNYKMVSILGILSVFWDPGK